MVELAEGDNKVTNMCILVYRPHVLKMVDRNRVLLNRNKEEKRTNVPNETCRDTKYVKF